MRVFIPFREKGIWTREEKNYLKFFPLFRRHFNTLKEFEKFGFTKEEEEEILREYFSKGEEKKSKESADELDSKHGEHSGVYSKERSSHSGEAGDVSKERGHSRGHSTGEDREGEEEIIFISSIHPSPAHKKEDYVHEMPTYPAPPPPLPPSHEDQDEKGGRGEENTYIIPANLSGRNEKQINFWKNALKDGIEIGEEKIEKTHIIEREEPPSPPPLISPLVTPIVQGNEKGTIRDRLRPRQKKAVAAAARTAQPTQAGGCPLEPTAGGSAKADGPTPGPEVQAPKTLAEARKGLYWKGFEKAIETEVGNLEKNSTWEYVNIKEIPRGTNILQI